MKTKKALKLIVDSPNIPKERIFTKHSKLNNYLKFIKKYHPGTKIEISTITLD